MDNEIAAAVGAADMRSGLARDSHRPLYHFLPPANWMNDPNGLIHWNDEYHLFYQYNPDGAYHGRIHWGHAVSPDLVHWKHRPVALEPTPGGPDADGCWSGSGIDAGGTPMFFYTGVYPQSVCVATGDQNLSTLRKAANNPLIGGPPPEINAGNPADFRDPYVWREGGFWYMVMGSRVEGQGGIILLYRSADLVSWEYCHPILVGDQTRYEPFWTATVWECPNLFPLDGRHIVTVSFQDHANGHLLYAGYYVGDFSGERFTPVNSGILEYGGHLYAPLSTTDALGRRILIGWLLEGRGPYAMREAGWAGVMSLPRVLSVGDDDTVRMTPVPELQRLRGKHIRLENRAIEPDSANVLSGLRGDCLEIEACLEPMEASGFGLRVRCSPDGVEQTTLFCDVVSGTVTIDRQHASLDDSAWRDSGQERAAVWNAPLRLSPGRPVKLHLFLDRSVIELFIDDYAVLSSRIYPTRPDSLGVELFTEGGGLRVHSIDAWQMKAIWPVV